MSSNVEARQCLGCLSESDDRDPVKGDTRSKPTMSWWQIRNGVPYGNACRYCMMIYQESYQVHCSWKQMTHLLSESGEFFALFMSDRRNLIQKLWDLQERQ